MNYIIYNRYHYLYSISDIKIDITDRVYIYSVILKLYSHLQTYIIPYIL